MNIEEEIARALDKHGHVYDSDCGDDFGCACGVIDDYDNSTMTHAQHLAAALMPLFRRAQAEAWGEGYVRGWGEGKSTELSEHEHRHPANPYIEQEVEHD